MYFAIWATDRDGMLSERQRVRDAHRERLRNPVGHAVRVVAGGPTLSETDGAMNGSLLIVEADSVESVRRFIADDPYSLAQVYANVQIRPWNWSLGRPSELPKAVDRP
jgi:uncharacterized protein YciI